MKYYMTNLEKIVKQIYDRIGVDETDVPIDEIANRLGISLFYYDVSFSVNGSIFIDRRLTKRKQKEVFSHELCHCLYHVGNQLDMPDLYRQYQENKADNFAMHFSVPTFMLQKINFSNNRYVAAAEISDIFCVTKELAFKRLEHYQNQLFGAMFHKKLMCAENKTIYIA